ncbi:7-alpha-hydroxysteroid dehydrogenase [Oryzisolibacter propanilivorax]|uniref:7-alpha-hydroxysteroid dehydrogenase n=1 Tax=Oryzisolibacter propanilivorax TaxID=1527607 RepID=A0A1G9NWY4_9BURK|nr:glucose 1-dehydrogenase [Oryzisolibacter propanilivorax]SDL90909.1 7-alpha-hydroxysteroid dehydrogenase [Oryzisolibacter propanilivorax]
MTANVFDQFSVQGQVAAVTGAGKGIGRACALMLARAGADVALFARTEADLHDVHAQITALGRRAIVVPGDANQEADLDQLVSRTVAELGKLTILVNNVGGGGPNDPRKVGGKALGEVLAFNVVPAYSLIQKAAAAMEAAGGGSVINISSMAARLIQKNFSAYSAAKAALNHLTRNLAQDYGPAVRINAIEPGTIMTEALAPYLTADRKERMERTTPLGRLGQPEDIAAATLFLASPASSWITGKVLGVDGGVEAPNF